MTCGSTSSSRATDRRRSSRSDRRSRRSSSPRSCATQSRTRAGSRAMLEAERALAAASAAVGLVPRRPPARIARCVPRDLYDTERLARRRPRRRQSGGAARPRAPRRGRRRGRRLPSTSARRARTSSTRRRCSSRAERSRWCSRARPARPPVARRSRVAHRDTPMAARTLLQQAVPTTFGLKAAGWLTAHPRGTPAARGARRAARGPARRGGRDARGARRRRRSRSSGSMPRELGLAEPRLRGTRTGSASPSSAQRSRAAAGAAAKVGLDIVLLAQTEVGEVRGGVGRGVLDHAAEAKPGVARPSPWRARGSRMRMPRVLLGGLVHEHERAVGAWHAEWEALSGALAFAGGAAAAAADARRGLEVDAARMRQNLDASAGLVLAERVSFALTPRLGRPQARTSVVADAARAPIVPRRARSPTSARGSRRRDRRAARPRRLPRSGRGAGRPLARGLRRGARRDARSPARRPRGRAHARARRTRSAPRRSSGARQLPTLARALPRPHVRPPGSRPLVAARAAVHRRGARARPARAPRRARDRALVVLRRLARRDGRHGARARGAASASSVSSSRARPPTSGRPTAGGAARGRSRRGTWRRSRTPSSGAGSRPSSRRTTRTRRRASARCSSRPRPRATRAAARRSPTWDARDRIADIAAPVLVVAGADDPATPVEHAELIASRIPDARLVVLEHAAHLANVERAEAFNEALWSISDRRCRRERRRHEDETRGSRRRARRPCRSRTRRRSRRTSRT